MGVPRAPMRVVVKTVLKPNYFIISSFLVDYQGAVLKGGDKGNDML